MTAGRMVAEDDSPAMAHLDQIRLGSQVEALGRYLSPDAAHLAFECLSSRVGLCDSRPSESADRWA